MADLTLNEYTGLENEEIKTRLNQEYNIIHSAGSSDDLITPIVNSGYERVKITISRLNHIFSRQLFSLFSRKRFTSGKQPLIMN